MRHSFILIYRPDVRYIVVNIMIRRGLREDLTPSQSIRSDQLRKVVRL